MIKKGKNSNIKISVEGHLSGRYNLEEIIIFDLKNIPLNDKSYYQNSKATLK
jgi:hypothetical protein